MQVIMFFYKSVLFYSCYTCIEQCVYMQVCVCMYVYVYSVYIQVCVCMYTCTVCIYKYVYVCIRVQCVYTSMCMSV
jgi:hypothetical protein